MPVMLVIASNVDYLIILAAFFVEEASITVTAFEVTICRATFIEDVVYIVLGFNVFGFANIATKDKHFAAG
jgi:cadmium resistance protein CadD (predicted permease)